MSNICEKKDTTMTFRTSSAVREKIESLAERVNQNKYDFPWNSSMRDCKSKSGLIHQLCAENLTIAEIEKKVNAVEAKNGS